MKSDAKLAAARRWRERHPERAAAEAQRRTERRRADPAMRERENTAARATYQSVRRTARERFQAKTAAAGDCVLWTGQIRPDGYGSFWLDGTNVPAHRAALIIEGVMIPPGFVVCHRCDVPACVRRNHLFVGTQADNLADMSLKGRAPTGTAWVTAHPPERRARGEHHGSRVHPERFRHP